MKFSVDKSLDAKKYEEALIGQSLQIVMKYWTFIGKFNGVHPDLKEIGVTEVRVTDHGLEFFLEMSNNKRNNLDTYVSAFF